MKWYPGTSLSYLDAAVVGGIILPAHKETADNGCFTLQILLFWFKLVSSWLVLSSEQVVWRPTWKAPFAIATHNWQGPHAWKSLVSNVSTILSSSSSPTPSLSSPSPSWWPQRSVIYWWNSVIVAPTNSSRSNISLLTPPDSTWEDLRYWQTLIQDFEIGAIRCQTSTLTHIVTIPQSSGRKSGRR